MDFSLSPSLNGASLSTRSPFKRIGLSEYTSQRLAELKARQAEAEEDLKSLTGSPKIKVQGDARGITSVEKRVVDCPLLKSEVVSLRIKPEKVETVPRETIKIVPEIDQQQLDDKSSLSAEKTNENNVETFDTILLQTRDDEKELSVNYSKTYHQYQCGPTNTVKPSTRESTEQFQIPSAEKPSTCTNSKSESQNNHVTFNYNNTSRSEAANMEKSFIKSPLTMKKHLQSGDVEEDGDDDDYVGFASLPDQVHRKAVKKGFNFTLMVVGESGLGKSTLISCLFQKSDMYKERVVANCQEMIHKTTSIEKKVLEIEEKGVRLKLTVIDTPGFNDSLNTHECWKPICNYVEEQHDKYYSDENGLNRRSISDTRVHCCLFFLSPLARGIRQTELVLMKELQSRVNIIPIIAKSDTLTCSEIKKLKEKILEELRKNDIKIYELPECDSDEDEDFIKQDKELKAAIPFAVVGSNGFFEIGGKNIRGRMYPWGVVDVDNPSHCDFTKLRQFLIGTHMQDLKDTTQEVHYENFRAGYIQEQLVKTQKERNKLKRDSVQTFDKALDADFLLKQKEEEIQRMKEMLKNMEHKLLKNVKNST